MSENNQVIFTVATKDCLHEFHVQKLENLEYVLSLMSKYPEVNRIEFDTVEEYNTCVANLVSVINKLSNDKIEVSLEG